MRPRPTDGVLYTDFLEVAGYGETRYCGSCEGGVGCCRFTSRAVANGHVLAWVINFRRLYKAPVDQLSELHFD